MATYSKDLNTAEIAYAAIREVCIVVYFYCLSFHLLQAESVKIHLVYGFSHHNLKPESTISAFNIYFSSYYRIQVLYFFFKLILFAFILLKSH